MTVASAAYFTLTRTTQLKYENPSATQVAAVRQAPPPTLSPLIATTSAKSPLVAPGTGPTSSSVTKKPSVSAPITTTKTPAAQPTKPPLKAGSAPTQDSNLVSRIQAPYDTPPLSSGIANTIARAALVNIFCESENPLIKPSSGSGVIIDRRGIVLTNAHVAQRVLLSTEPQFRVSCVIRSGSPAQGLWKAAVLFMPTSWASKHARDLRVDMPRGTGEDDFALLWISSTVGPTPLPQEFPFLKFDTREAIAFADDQVLVASYPAELVGGTTARNNLYAVTSVTTIKNLLTFSQSTVDQISLGGVIGAQGGSSGGAVVNAWGLLVGIITVTTEGPTTAARDLRAITLAHIDRSLQTSTGTDLAEFLAREPAALHDEFEQDLRPGIIGLYSDLAF